MNYYSDNFVENVLKNKYDKFFGKKETKIVCAEPERLIKKRIVEIFGRDVDLWQIAACAGFPRGATVEIELEKPEDHRPALGLTAFHKVLETPAVLLIYRENEKVNLNYVLLHTHQSSPPGLGTCIIYRCLKNCYKVGIDRVVTQAVRGERYNGYYTFPRWGFSEKVNINGQTVDLSRFLQHPANAWWWRQNGWSVCLSFDTSPSSDNWNVLATYLRERLDHWQLSNSPVVFG